MWTHPPFTVFQSLKVRFDMIQPLEPIEGLMHWRGRGKPGIAEASRAEPRGNKTTTIAERIALGRNHFRLVQVKLVMARPLRFASGPLTA